MATNTKVCPFKADDRVESWLNSFNVQWEGPVVLPIGNVDIRESRKNQARSEALIPEAVDAYTVAMNNGDKFPAVVSYVHDGADVIVDGNNRYAAAQKHGATHYATYRIAIDTPSQLIAAMTASANARNGVSVDKSWRVIQAEYLVSTFNYTLEKAAALLNVRESDIKNYQKLLAINERVAQTNISMKVWNTLSPASRLMIGEITNVNVFALLAKTAIEYDLTGATLRDFVKEIKLALKRSEADALTYVEEYSDVCDRQAKMAKQQGRRALRTPQIGFNTGVGKILAVNTEKFNRTFLTQEDRDLANERLNSVIRHALELKVEVRGRANAVNEVMDIASDIDRGV